VQTAFTTKEEDPIGLIVNLSITTAEDIRISSTQDTAFTIVRQMVTKGRFVYTKPPISPNN